MMSDADLYPAVKTMCSTCLTWTHSVAECIRIACEWRWQRIGYEDRQRRDDADRREQAREAEG